MSVSDFSYDSNYGAKVLMDMAHGGILETTEVGNGETAGAVHVIAHSLPQRLRDLASSFEKKGFWSSKYRVADLMNELADDIENNKNLDGWNRLNLPEEVEAMIEPAWYMRLVVRFGMFIPIVLSWWSIRQATSAYAKLSSNDLSDNSFLYWWVQGMQGRLLWFERLPNAALLTAGSIAILGLTGLFAGVPLARLRKDINREMQKAQIYIGQHAAFSPEEIRGAVSLLLAEMLTAGNTLRKSSTEGLKVIEKVSEQFETLRAYVADQSKLVGGELKTSVESSTSASNALMKSVESSREASVALGVSSQSLKDSITPINEMIRSANSLATSSLSASETLRDMVQSVPVAFHDPIGGMISAGEFLADAVAEMARQMGSLESLFAAVGHTRGAAEIQGLLMRIETASASVAAGQNNFSDLLMGIEAASTSVAAGQTTFNNQANEWWRDLQSLQQGMSSLTDELNSLKIEIRQQRPPENF